MGFVVVQGYIRFFVRGDLLHSAACSNLSLFFFFCCVLGELWEFCRSERSMRCLVGSRLLACFIAYLIAPWRCVTSMNKRALVTFIFRLHYFRTRIHVHIRYIQRVEEMKGGGERGVERAINTWRFYFPPPFVVSWLSSIYVHDDPSATPPPSPQSGARARDRRVGGVMTRTKGIRR